MISFPVNFRYKISAFVCQDFTLEQDSITPVNGWKAYYAATRAIMNVNTEFFNIIRNRSLTAMSCFWLNADYVKCVHASGEHFSGYVLSVKYQEMQVTTFCSYDDGVLKFQQFSSGFCNGFKILAFRCVWVQTLNKANKVCCLIILLILFLECFPVDFFHLKIG